MTRLSSWHAAAGGRRATTNNLNSQPRPTSWAWWQQRETPQSNWLRTLWGTALALDLIMVVMQATVIGVICSDDHNATLTTSVPLVQHTMHLAMSIYNFILLWDALHRRNLPQLIGAIAMHFSSAIYAILQATLDATLNSEFTSDNLHVHRSLHAIKVIDAIIALAGAVVLASLVRKARGDFGWRVFKHLGADPRLKRVYAIHHSLLAAIKINLFYFIIYLLQYGLLSEISAKSPTKGSWIEYDSDSNLISIAISVGAGIPLSVLNAGLVILAVVVIGIQRENRGLLSVFIFTLMLGSGFLLYHITMASTQAIQFGYDTSEGFIISLVTATLSFLWITITAICAFSIFPYFGSGIYRHVRRSEIPKEIMPGAAGYQNTRETIYENATGAISRWSIE
ncbi:hypothetical protein BDF19DRAFT_410270 [Syncephalis fuscata]|nr:hypothetical protein BDF19DRAFT_410270 [Syncephalis fuscata]